MMYTIIRRIWLRIFFYFIRCCLKDIKRFSKFSKMLVFSYRFKKFPKFMAAKSFTSSSVKICKQSSILRICNIMFIIRTIFFQIKVITVIKNYNQSVEIKNIPNWPIFLTILMEFELLVVRGQEKPMCYWT